MILRLWREHSRTIVGLTVGGGLVVLGRIWWPDGGVDFDLMSLVGGILLAFGLQGILDNWFCETAKPEDSPGD